MGEVVAFPRKKAPCREYTAAELARAHEDVERMLASGFSEEDAYGVAVIRLRMVDSHGD